MTPATTSCARRVTAGSLQPAVKAFATCREIGSAALLIAADRRATAGWVTTYGGFTAGSLIGD
jgi:hypothetical protein